MDEQDIMQRGGAIDVVKVVKEMRDNNHLKDRTKIRMTDINELTHDAITNNNTRYALKRMQVLDIQSESMIVIHLIQEACLKDKIGNITASFNTLIETIKNSDKRTKLFDLIKSTRTSPNFGIDPKKKRSFYERNVKTLGSSAPLDREAVTRDDERLMKIAFLYNIYQAKAIQEILPKLAISINNGITNTDGLDLQTDNIKPIITIENIKKAFAAAADYTTMPGATNPDNPKHTDRGESAATAASSTVANPATTDTTRNDLLIEDIKNLQNFFNKEFSTVGYTEFSLKFSKKDVKDFFGSEKSFDSLEFLSNINNNSPNPHITDIILFTYGIILKKFIIAKMSARNSPSRLKMQKYAIDELLSRLTDLYQIMETLKITLTNKPVGIDKQDIAISYLLMKESTTINKNIIDLLLELLLDIHNNDIIENYLNEIKYASFGLTNIDLEQDLYIKEGEINKIDKKAKKKEFLNGDTTDGDTTGYRYFKFPDTSYNPPPPAPGAPPPPRLPPDGPSRTPDEVTAPEINKRFDEGPKAESLPADTKIGIDMIKDDINKRYDTITKNQLETNLITVLDISTKANNNMKGPTDGWMKVFRDEYSADDGPSKDTEDADALPKLSNNEIERMDTSKLTEAFKARTPILSVPEGEGKEDEMKTRLKAYEHTRAKSTGGEGDTMPPQLTGDTIDLMSLDVLTAALDERGLPTTDGEDKMKMRLKAYEETRDTYIAVNPTADVGAGGGGKKSIKKSIKKRAKKRNKTKQVKKSKRYAKKSR